MAFLSSRWGGLAVLAALILLLPLGLQNSFHYDVVIKIGFNAIMVIGLNLLIGYAGQISLGHAAFFGLGAYGSAILAQTYGVPPLLALPISAALVALLAFLVARPILKLKGHYLAMATLGIGLIVSIVLNNESRLTGGPDGMSVPGLSILGLAIKGERMWYWVVGGLLLLTIWLSQNLIDSAFGRSLRAVNGSEVAAETLGVDTARAKVLIFTISAAIASVTGSLYAHYSGFITPDEASFFHSIELVTMVVFGGMASTFGVVFGAAILTALPQFLAALADYEHMIFGLIMMVTMIFMPRGLVPTIARAWKGRKAS